MNMTNAEKIAELNLKASQLEKEVEQMLASSNAPLDDKRYIDAVTNGLQLKSNADLFNQEELAILAKVEDLQRDAFEVLHGVQHELSEIIEAEREAQGYATRIGESLEDIRARNTKEHEDASDVVAQAYTLSAMAKANGWQRYAAILQKDNARALEEAQAIIESVKLVEWIKPLPNDTFHFPIESLRIQHETDLFIAQKMYLNPVSFLECDTGEQLTMMNNLLKPMLYHHRKALKGDSKSLALIDICIDRKRSALANEPTTEIEQYTSPYPDNYYFPKDKISNSLTKLVNGEKTPVALESKAEKKRGIEITGYVTINFDGITEETSVNGVKVSVSTEKAIEPYERSVINAVFTVWENARVNGEIIDGTATTTLRNLYRIITQNKTSDPTEEAMEEIKDILTNKLATGRMQLDVSEEAKQHKSMGDFAERSGAFMQVVVDRKRVHGKLTDVVYISRLDLSPLYAYSSITSRIAKVPMKQLETKSRNKNKETVVIGDYILSRVEAIPHISSTIVIDTLLNEVGIYESEYKNWKDKRAKTVRKVLDILDGYKRTGLIKDYSVNKRGRSKQYSITIKK